MAQVTITPADGATDVEAWPMVKIVFDVAMDATTINNATVKLERPDGGYCPMWQVPYDPAAKTATLMPAQPLDLSVGYLVRVTAGCKDPAGTPVAETTAAFTTAAAAKPVRFNCGGPAYTAQDGRAFLADATPPTVKGGTAVTGGPVSGTDGKLYETHRQGAFTYAVGVPNATYTVTLHFAEPAKAAANQRKFNVDIVGETTANPDLAALDVYAEAGGKNKPLVKTITGASVTARQLHIRTSAVVDLPILAAIEIVQA